MTETTPMRSNTTPRAQHAARLDAAELGRLAAGGSQAYLPRKDGNAAAGFAVLFAHSLEAVGTDGK